MASADTASSLFKVFTWISSRRSYKPSRETIQIFLFDVKFFRMILFGGENASVGLVFPRDSFRFDIDSLVNCELGNSPWSSKMPSRCGKQHEKRVPGSNHRIDLISMPSAWLIRTWEWSNLRAGHSGIRPLLECNSQAGCKESMQLGAIGATLLSIFLCRAFRIPLHPGRRCHRP